MRDWANAIRPYNFSHHSVGANRIRPRLYSPPFAFVHVYIHPIIIRLYHYFIEQMPIGRMRFAPTIFPHHSVDIVVGAYSIGRIHNGRMRLGRMRLGRMRFAPTETRYVIAITSRINLKIPLHTPQNTRVFHLQRPGLLGIKTRSFTLADPGFSCTPRPTFHLFH